jgi:phage-related protein
MPETMKPLSWIGSSYDDFTAFPVAVQHDMGFALFVAQCGDRHPSAKPLKGFGGAGVMEIVESFEGNAYRAVYTVKFAQRLYVLHAFQKKSRKGIATPAQELALIKKRYRLAADEYRRLQEKGHGNG